MKLLPTIPFPPSQSQPCRRQHRVERDPLHQKFMRQLSRWQRLSQKQKKRFKQIHVCVSIEPETTPHHRLIRYKVNDQICYTSQFMVSCACDTELYNLENPTPKEQPLFSRPVNQFYRYFNMDQVVCNYCHRQGHMIQDCQKLEKWTQYKISEYCEKCQTRGHSTQDCKVRKDDDRSDSDSDDWIFDEGRPVRTGLIFQVDPKPKMDDIDY